MKLMSFESAVNVTIGLPIVRTWVDHGTACDIAWQGKAFTGSVKVALDDAWRRGGYDVDRGELPRAEATCQSTWPSHVAGSTFAARDAGR